MSRPTLPRFRRFVVDEHSMLPTLEPGDGLIGVRTTSIRRGELRCVEHPDIAGFWLVKRVGEIRPGRFEARSDNSEVAAIDSRQLGWLPIEGSYRVLVRVPHRFLR